MAAAATVQVEARTQAGARFAGNRAGHRVDLAGGQVGSGPPAPGPGRTLGSSLRKTLWLPGRAPIQAMQPK
jgi:hypothetical protein